MIAKTVFAYLEPYLPYQMVYGISMIAFFFEKFIMPKFYQVYSNASLDPKSLIPFIISAIALYLSIVSIYHAFRAAFRMVWFLLKWSIVIVLAWLVLAFVNDLRDRSEGGHKIGIDLLQDYQNSFLSWWQSTGWNSINLKDQLGFDPLQMLFGPSFLTVFQPFFNPFQPQTPPTSSGPLFNSQKKHSSSSSQFGSTSGTKNTFDQTKSRKKPSYDPPPFNLPQSIRQFWVQSVRTPIQTIIKQSQSKYQSSQTKPRSQTRTR